MLLQTEDSMAVMALMAEGYAAAIFAIGQGEAEQG